MIVGLFIAFIFFALILLFYGFYSRTDTFRLIGITLIFFLAVGLSPFMPNQIGGVEYETGLIETVNGSITTTERTFTEYKSHALSFYLMAFAIITLWIIMLDRKDYDN